MIAFDFAYYRPATLAEAVRLYAQLSRQGLQPLYYSGGTEIITLGRLNIVYTNAVVDIKDIPECRALERREGRLMLGAALTLSRLYDSGVFPLLGETADGIADRTSRNKITFGGNLCSRFMYREAVLPLLLTDCELVTAGPDGLKRRSIHQLFRQTLHLEPGELLVQAEVDERYVAMPYRTVKRRKQAAIDYPLVTVAALKTDTRIRFAFSGVCAFPFRSEAMENILNDKRLPVAERTSQALTQLPAPVLDDIKGSAEYRSYVLQQTLIDTITRLGGE